MWKQKIGISVGYKYECPITEVVRLVAEAGFDAISPTWSAGDKLTEMVEAARAYGLALQSMHAPLEKSADMWSDEEPVYGPAVEELLVALEDCRRYEIPVMVVHVWIGFDYTFGETVHGFAHYDMLVKRAKKYGIRIAFENTEGEEYLRALMEHYKGNETVGFCWDSGHEMCYNGSRDLLAEFGERLYMTHLNDNLGVSRFDGRIYWTDDLHLLPYDGVADWDYNIARLRSARPIEYLNFELNIASKPGRHENDCYGRMSLEEYFAECYKRACRIAYRYAAGR